MFDFILYMCICVVFCEKKLVVKKNNLIRFIFFNWKEKEEKYVKLYDII